MNRYLRPFAIVSICAGVGIGWSVIQNSHSSRSTLIEQASASTKGTSVSASDEEIRAATERFHASQQAVQNAETNMTPQQRQERALQREYANERDAYVKRKSDILDLATANELNWRICNLTQDAFAYQMTPFLDNGQTPPDAALRVFDYLVSGPMERRYVYSLVQRTAYDYRRNPEAGRNGFKSEKFMYDCLVAAKITSDASVYR